MKRRTGGLTAAPLSTWLKGGVVGGLAGGLAEIVFMGAYCLASGKSGASILSLITFTFSDRGFAFGPLGASAGVLIHFALSVLIGVLFSIAMFLIDNNTDKESATRTVVSGAILLTGIWAFNFFILLPNINPEFVALVPAKVAFFSKFLFGLSLGVLVNQVSGAPALKGNLKGCIPCRSDKDGLRYVNE